MSIIWREGLLVVTGEIIGITGASQLPPHTRGSSLISTLYLPDFQPIDDIEHISPDVLVPPWNKLFTGIQEHRVLFK
jgi:hypothetical protein